jgi:hypothetical protein
VSPISRRNRWERVQQSQKLFYSKLDFLRGFNYFIIPFFAIGYG